MVQVGVRQFAERGVDGRCPARKRRSVFASCSGASTGAPTNAPARCVTGDNMARIRQAEPMRTPIGTAAPASGGADRRRGETISCTPDTSRATVRLLSHIAAAARPQGKARASADGSSGWVRRRPALPPAVAVERRDACAAWRRQVGVPS